MHLAGEAAIVGIAELPAERKPTRSELFTLDQYALLAKMVVEDAGLDAGVVNGLISHGLAESDMFVPATLSEYLGLPIDFGERVDLGGATSAGMVWRAAVAVELGLCDAVLAVVPGSRALPRSTRRPPSVPNWLWRVEQQLRLATGGVRNPVRQRRQNAPFAQIAQRYGAQYGYDPSAWRRLRWISAPMPAHTRVRCSAASPSPRPTCWAAR